MWLLTTHNIVTVSLNCSLYCSANTVPSSSAVSSSPLQNYLKEFAQLHEEFKARDVAVYAVCAQSQTDVDQAIKDWELNYKASGTPPPLPLPLLSTHFQWHGGFQSS